MCAAAPKAAQAAHLPLERVQGIQAAVHKDDALRHVAEGVEGVDGGGARLDCRRVNGYEGSWVDDRRRSSVRLEKHRPLPTASTHPR